MDGLDGLDGSPPHVPAHCAGARGGRGRRRARPRAGFPRPAPFHELTGHAASRAPVLTGHANDGQVFLGEAQAMLGNFQEAGKTLLKARAALRRDRVAL